MARIRTIKPEFPQSESMGRVSRDARLTFVQLWTLCDDEGRARGNSRMLASLLFPYDDDAPDLIDDWLWELEREGCIVRYQAERQSYVEICNWLIHQKIDKPSKSKIPPSTEGSRILANPRERSSEDQGSRIKDQGEDQGPQTHVAPAPVGSADDASSPPKPERRKEHRASDDVKAVFAYWQEVMHHPQAKLDDKRSKAIGKRLSDGYTVEELCRAVDGCKLTPHNMGQNDTGSVYDDVELICRDSGHVDRFLKAAQRGPVMRPPAGGLNRQEQLEQANRDVVRRMMQEDGQ